MRGPAPPPESAEMVREILLKLPTTDVARCRCVCRLWRGVVAEPTFSSLHAEAETNGNHVSAATEALLVTETREHGRPEEASFSIVSSSTPKPMPHCITIPGGYSLSNVCNGLLCFAFDSAEAPAFICSPVTGETATVPTPVGRRLPEGTVYHHYALGFSPSTKEHKLFRFSFPPSNSPLGNKIDQSVCTLGGGGGGGWRRRSFYSQSNLMRTLPPVLVDGSLYLVQARGRLVQARHERALAGAVSRG
ncbi:F-box protein DOR-like [Aegilops tauschii subsp. strangulata]|uniref:F-box protein DOR-like n=1 Tax=Aegilops tauschii subsp. strangulata TaxID=200361 RepID=UPI00098ABE94|nr:F-box protein DOR-like [Aegilops tauschii subsp. strangulata]